MVPSLESALERFKLGGGRIVEVIYPEGEDYRGREQFEQGGRDLRDQLAHAGFEIAEEALTHFLHDNALLLALDAEDSILGVLSYDEEGQERWITQMETMTERGGTGTALACAAALGWVGKLVVSAYEEAVPFYQKHLGMKVMAEEADGSLARLEWPEAAVQQAGKAFREAEMTVTRQYSLDGLKLKHTVIRRVVEIS